MLVAILAIIFALIDQLSKYIIIKHLSKDITIIKNLFYLSYAKNNGAAFSIFIGKRLFLIIITIVIILTIIYYIFKNKIDNKIDIIAFSMILGGAFGNLIDRLIRGYVVDFISVKIFNYPFPIFNVADSLICIGVFLIFYKTLRKERKNDNRRYN